MALVDGASFPRDKVCGDALSPESVAELRGLGINDALERAHFVDGSYAFAPDGNWMVTRCAERGALLPRRHLDVLLVEQARAMGARFLPGRRFTGLDRTQDALIVRTDRGDGVRGRCAVLATGCNAAALKAADVLRGSGAPSAFGMRAYFEGVDCRPDKIVHAFDGFLLPDFGWIFPLGGGRANVGVAAHCRPGGRLRLREKFERFTQDSPSARRFLRGARQVSPAGTAPLRLGLTGADLVADRLLVVGDAAGAGTPSNGEGIAPALVTGRLAAQTIRDALQRENLSRHGLRAYGVAVRRAYGLRYRRAHWIRRLLACPTVVNLIARWGEADPALADRLAWVLTGKHSACTLPWRELILGWHGRRTRLE